MSDDEGDVVGTVELMEMAYEVLAVSKNVQASMREVCSRC